VFTGGIIIVANTAPPDMPEWAAIRTRVPALNLVISDLEVRAKMRELAGRGHQWGGREMQPSECLEVAEFLIAESASMARPLDLRLLSRSFNDYLSWREGATGCHWTDLVRSAIQERLPYFRQPVRLTGGRVARREEQQRIAAEIAAETDDTKEQYRLWEERTGRRPRTFHRHLTGK
jgi:hypothetical protein